MKVQYNNRCAVFSSIIGLKAARRLGFLLRQLLLLVIMTVQLGAQEKYWPIPEVKEIKSALETRHGQLLLAGDQGWLIEFNPNTGEYTKINTFPDWQINKIIQTMDGGYLLIGAKTVKGAGNKSRTRAGLWALTWEGKPKGPAQLFEDGVFNDGLQLDDGSIMVVGHKNKISYALHIQAGKPSPIGGTKFAKAGEFTAICRGKGGELAACGTDLVSKNGFWIPFQLHQTNAARVYPLSFSEARSISYDPINAQYLVCGKEAFSSILESNKSRATVIDQFKQRDLEWKHILSGLDGTVVVFGSYYQGNDKDLLWIQSDGKQLQDHTSRNIASGGNKSDYFTQAVLTQAGNLYGIGSSDNKGMVFRLPTKFAIAQAKTKQPFEMLSVQLRDPNQDSILDAGEQAYLEIQVRNNSSEDFFDLQLQTKGLEPYSLTLWSNLLSGHLPRFSTRSISLPLPASAHISSLRDSIEITLKSNQLLLSRFKYQLISKSRPLPRLQIVRCEFEHKRELPRRGDSLSVRVIIKNIGEGRAEKAQVGTRFFHPYNVRSLDDQQKLVKEDIALGYENKLLSDTLGAGDTTEFIYNFCALSYFIHDSIPIQAVAYLNNISLEDDTLIHLRIENFYTIRLPDGTNYLPKNIPKGKGPNDEFDVLPHAENLIKREAPSETKDVKGYLLDTMTIKYQVNSIIQLDSSNMIFSKGKGLDQKVFPWKEVIVNSHSTSTGWQYNLVLKVKLDTGVNYITLSIKNGKKELDADEITIERVKVKVSNYVLSIGVKYDSSDLNFSKLKYTQNDAIGFADVFKAKNSRVLYDKQYTNATTLNSAFKDPYFFITGVAYTTNGSNDPAILLNDVVIVLFSGHGNARSSPIDSKSMDFHIISSSSSDNRYDSIDFFKQVIYPLFSLRYHKIYFFDVCQGRIQNSSYLIPDSKTIVLENSKDGNFSIIMASEPEKPAYESRQFSHGFLTQALIEALKNAKDKDYQLSIKTLFEYVRKRVPELAGQENKNQQPVLYISRDVNLNHRIIKTH